MHHISLLFEPPTLPHLRILLSDKRLTEIVKIWPISVLNASC